jgi:hypothetical protein
VIEADAMHAPASAACCCDNRSECTLLQVMVWLCVAVSWTVCPTQVVTSVPRNAMQWLKLLRDKEMQLHCFSSRSSRSAYIEGIVWYVRKQGDHIVVTASTRMVASVL